MILHMDNFQIYGQGGQSRMLEGIWSNVNGTALDVDPDPNVSGLIAPHVTDFGHLGRGMRFVMPTAQQVVGAAWRWWVNTIPVDTNDRPNVRFYNSVGQEIITLTINLVGGIDVRAGDVTAAIIASTPGPVVTASGWYHIECRLDCGVSGGVEIRVEGKPVLVLTNHNFNTTSQIVLFGMWSANGILNSCYYKDVVVWNDQGTHNTDFLGSVLVLNLEPVADVALNWTPTGATNGFSILDNIPTDDTKYIAAQYPPPAAYKCSLSDLPVDITSVRAVMTLVRASKVDGGDGSLQNGVISNGVLVNGSDRPITVAQTYWRDIFEEDPNTHAPWLPAAVNAVTMQINRTT